MKELNDMDEIRDLLFGSIEKDSKSDIKQINRKISELREDMRREVNSLSKSIKGVIHQLDIYYEDKFSTLEQKIDNRMKSHKKVNDGELKSLRKEQLIQKEFVSESLDAIREVFDNRLGDVKSDFFENSVSKEDLASVFFESAVKLKNGNLVSEIKNKIR